MKYLIVVAHPDDEVLGAGASIYKWTKQGDVVDVCIMCTEAKARAFRPDDKELDDDTHAALAYIGFTPKITLREGLSKFTKWYKEYYI